MADREPTPGQHGGYRPGAGGKKGVSVQRPADGTNHYAVLAAAKAKREMYRAALTEVQFKQQAGELYDRSEVLRVIATAIAVFAEQIRSLPDKLERQAGISPEQAEIAEEEVNTQLDALRNRLVQGLAAGVPQDALIGALRDMLAGVEYGEQ